MAARRLVAVLIVLLVVSTVAAALAPGPTEEPPPRETTSRPPADPPPVGRRVRAAVDAGGRRERILVDAGDQLALTVRSRRPDQASLGGLGETEATDRYAPATFDVYVAAPGSYPVRLLESRRVAATIVARRVSREARSERPRSRGRDRRG